MRSGEFHSTFVEGERGEVFPLLLRDTTFAEAKGTL
jgi:hypothetical protein